MVHADTWARSPACETTVNTTAASSSEMRQFLAMTNENYQTLWFTQNLSGEPNPYHKYVHFAFLCSDYSHLNQFVDRLFTSTKGRVDTVVDMAERAPK